MTTSSKLPLATSQRVFRTTTIGWTAAILWQIRDVFYDLPTILTTKASDLQWIITCACVMAVARVSLAAVFTRVGEYVISPKYTDSDRELRCKRFGNVVTKCLYFTVASVWGQTVLKDTPWFPPLLGGQGDSKEAHDAWDPQIPYSDQVKHYYYLGLSYHMVNSIYDVVIMPDREDFWELVFHHVVTLNLIVFSLYDNILMCGTMVLYVHDVPDVFTYLTKALVDTPNTVAALTSYAAMLISWAYYRLYAFPVTAILPLLTVSPDRMKLPFLRILLPSLLVLHVHWYLLMLRLGYRYATQGILSARRKKEM
jgi:hypothetical protein